MSPHDARTRLLRAELARDWGYVKANLARALSTDPAAGAAEAAFVALAIDRSYQAWESLLVRLERGLGLPDRSGSLWHRETLSAAALAVPGLRPPVYPAEVEEDWVELLGFRHFLRHAYEVELDPARLKKVVGCLGRAIAGTEQHIEALLDALV